MGRFSGSASHPHRRLDPRRPARWLSIDPAVRVGWPHRPGVPPMGPDTPIAQRKPRRVCEPCSGDYPECRVCLRFKPQSLQASLWLGTPGFATSAQRCGNESARCGGSSSNHATAPPAPQATADRLTLRSGCPDCCYMVTFWMSIVVIDKGVGTNS